MINTLFYAPRNKNAIKSIINEKIESKYKIKINNNYDAIIDETMGYVLSQISSTPPKGVKEEEYLFLMNKKVYDIVTPIIEKKELNKNIPKEIKTKIVPIQTSIGLDYNENKNNNNNSMVKEAHYISTKKNIDDPDKINNQLVDKLFDPILLKNFESQPLMDYPKPTFKSTNQNPDIQVKKIEDERSTLTPKIKPIDFTIKNDNENKGNTVQMYNELLTSYNTQITNMNDFDNEQKNINKKIEFIEDKKLLESANNQKMFNPINLLKNKNETSNFFGIENKANNSVNLNNSLLKNTSNEIAFNRNDIETFIPNDYEVDNGINNDIGNGIEAFINNQDFSNNPNNIILDKLNNLEFKNINNSNISSKSNFNNDINTYNRNQIQSLEFSSALQNNNLLIEPKFKLIEKKYFVIFDSKNRDLEEYPLQVEFQVKFSPASNNFIYESFYDSYNTLILKEKNINYGTNTEINIQETFDNITSIKCTYASVPTNVIWYASTGPQTTESGVPISIFTQPYVFLTIPEIKGPYRGGNAIVSNAFAKLGVDETSNVSGKIIGNYFTTLIVNEDEVFLYNPVSAGKIDKMTLKMYDKYGQLYNFGIDKLYIDSFKQGTEKLNGYCGDPFISTIFTIQNKNSNYVSYCSTYYKITPCNVLNSHPIKEGNKIYFYNTYPNADQIAFLEDYIKISKIKYISANILNIYLLYKKTIDGKEKNINVLLKDIIPGGNDNNTQLFKDYYVVIYDTSTGKYYYCSIISFSNTYISVQANGLPNYSKYANLKIGVAKKNLRGNTENDLNSLFSIYGHTVINIGDDVTDNFNIEINFPYANLPEYIKDGTYQGGDIFLIQDKMQISYSFEITTQIKDYDTLNSRVNESGYN